jgi:hypothetical protein
MASPPIRRRQGCCVFTCRWVQLPQTAAPLVLVQVAKHGEFYQRIFPIILEDAQIYDPIQRLKYIKYWEDKKKELNEAIKEVGAEFLQGVREEIDQYAEIRNTIAELASILKNMNTLTPDIHSDSDFEVLLEALAQGIRKAIDVGKSASSNVSAVYPSSGFTAEALSPGSSITVQQFVGNQATLNDQLAFFIQQIGLVSPRQDYTTSQFKSYCNIWKSIQALRLAGNNLWERASKENFVKFSNQLRETSQLVHEDSIFFEESDYSELRSVLEEFELFHIGKERLIDIRSTQDFEIQEKLFSPHQFQKMISQQITENEQHKVQYEKVLDRVRVSFRQKLSSAA